jgi:hypothetical protein
MACYKDSFTFFMDQSSSWETNSRSAIQEIFLLCNKKVHYRF